MAAIADETAAIVLAKCGRRCCICRRFKPTLLQVHHIVERSSGGDNELENLIALCLICHTDVHSRVPFTRRFTPTELKMHREGLYKLVADGVLPINEEEPRIQLTADRKFDVEPGRASCPKLSIC